MRSSSLDRNLILQAVALIGMGVLLIGLMLGVLRLQTSLQFWLHAHHRWVQAETQMADALEVYASTGDENFLRRAEKAMHIPMGAREARLAADSNPVDMVGIRRGLMQVGMDPRDIDGMAWVYLEMADWPYIRDAIDVWLRVDADIDQLANVGQAIKADVDAGRLTQARSTAHREAIAKIRQRIDGYTWEFSNVLIAGLRTLRTALITISVLLFVGFVVLFLYILRRFFSRIRSSEGWLRASFEQANVGMLQLADDSRIEYANAAAARILGLGTEACMAHKLQDFIAYRDQPRFMRAVRGEEDDQPMEDSDQYLLLTADGRQQVVRASVTAVAADERAEPAGLRFAMIEDVTEAHAMRAELARQARYDDLTGLLNRGELLRRIGQALHELKEGRIKHLSVCLIDLDHFRHINESVGLRVGDRILQVIAHRLHDAMGRVGHAGRLGSDQFVMVLPDLDSGDAMAFAARVAEALSQPDQELADSTMTPTNSIGVVSVDRLYTSASEVLAAATVACERAKQAGRNRVRLLMRDDEAGGDPRRSRADWATEIRSAISTHRFELLAQRIEPCRSDDRLLQAEVLIRMRDGDGQLVMPERFLPVAEMYGLSMAIDQQVLSKALGAIGEYSAAGGTPMVFYINLSASSVGEPDFATYVRHLLQDAPELAAMLCFEITESGVIANIEQATTFMDMVRQHGCKVALDDFGAGQSSFSQLRVLPVDIVKIDGSFMRDIDHDASSEVLIRSICEMSHVLDKRTVVEWVERQADVARVRMLGADYMQGFALHQPEALTGFLMAAVGEQRMAAARGVI